MAPSLLIFTQDGHAGSTMHISSLVHNMNRLYNDQPKAGRCMSMAPLHIQRQPGLPILNCLGRC